MNRTMYTCDSCGAGSSLITSPAESGKYLCPFCGTGNLVLNTMYTLQEAVNNRDLMRRQFGRTIYNLEPEDFEVN